MFESKFTIFQSPFPTTTRSTLQTETESLEARKARNRGLEDAISAKTLLRRKRPKYTSTASTEETFLVPLGMEKLKSAPMPNSNPFASSTPTLDPNQAAQSLELNEDNAFAVR